MYLNFTFLFRSPNLSRILGYRSCSSTYTPSSWRRYSPLRTRCIWKHVSWRSHVCTYQNLASVASQNQCQPAPLCNLFCYCCYWSSCSCYVKGYGLSTAIYIYQLYYLSIKYNCNVALKSLYGVVLFI